MSDMRAQRSMRRPADSRRRAFSLRIARSAFLSAAVLRAATVLGAASLYTMPVFGQTPPLDSAAAEAARLVALADLSAEWGEGVEAAIERAYRACFRTYLVGGRVMTLRLPFAENLERSELAASDLAVVGGGKSDPREIWASIDVLLAGKDFADYVAALSDGREKLIRFDLAARAWKSDLTRLAIERARTGLYQGLPHEPAVLVEGRAVRPEDVYNYLYCVGRVGIDCSGLVWHVLRTVAAEGGFDLERHFRSLPASSGGIPRKGPLGLYVGTWFFDPRSGRTRKVSDAIGDLLPGDIILFRGEDGSFLHSAVIQSIDFSTGRLRYLQSTDESPEAERGVHESFILFDPAHPEARLSDPALHWLQRRGATFAGEPEPAFRDDGERYRAYAEAGSGVVVRLKALERTIEKLRKRRGPPGFATTAPRGR